MATSGLGEELEGAVLDDFVRLERLVTAQADALFKGVLVDGGPVMVRVTAEDKSTGPVLDRYLEAQFFEHPNIHRPLRAGRFQAEGTQFVYAVFDPPDALLAEHLANRTLPPQEARKLALDVISALEYLHARGLVHCGLHTWAVANVDGVWRIADFSQMRLAGAGYAAETRKLMARNWVAPPEAFQGVVTPAWDSYELGQLLRTALTGLREERGRPRGPEVEVPERFRAVLTSALMHDPGQRASLEQIAHALSDSAAVVPVASEVPRQEAVARPIEPPVEPTPQAWTTPTAFDRAFERRDPRRDPSHDPSRRHRVASALAGALFGLLVLAFVLYEPPAKTSNVEKTRAAEPAQAAAPAPVESRNREPATQPQRPGGGTVESALKEWLEATRAGDLARQSAMYAPTVSRFYRARDVTPEWIRNYRTKDAESNGPVTSMEVDKVATRKTGSNSRTVTFDKAWRSRTSSGKVRSEFQMRQIDGDWKIVSERDIKTYYVRRS